MPDVFIAAFFITCGLHKPSDLDGQNGIIMMADKEMQRILEKGIAETHVHMGVCIEYEEYWGVKTNIKNWAAQLTNEDNYKKHGNKIPLEFSAAFFRMVAAEFFEVYELTFHVGEEFRHILSGLRHVDEVITHFKYKAGNRLGHAIVLAEDAERWVEEHEMVVMLRQEYMDDLLWLWGKAVYEEMDLGVSLDIVQGKIMELAKEIYGEIIGMTPDMLYDAYREKFRITDEQRIFEKLRKAMKKSSQKDDIHFCRFYNVKSKYGITWTKDKIFCTLYCPVYYKRLYQPVLVPVRRQMVPMYKKVQEQIIRRVEQIGIYVETNPTSNFIISGFQNLKESTAIVLNDKDLNGKGHEVMVTVNSDDPGVFNTTSENELAYIYHSLSNMGYGKESVMAWVDKIRQSGMDSSFVKKEKTASQMLVEIAEMLKRMEKT